MTTEPVTQPEITLDPVAWQAAIDAFAVLQEMVPLTLIRHALLAYINAAPVDPRIAQLEAEKARLVEALRELRKRTNRKPQPVYLMLMRQEIDRVLAAFIGDA